VSAPVLGRPNVAAWSQLNILAAGKTEAVAAIEPLLALLSKKVWKLGEDPARANAAKLACNMMIAMAIEAMAERVVLTESVGLDRADFFELILATLFSGRAYESYSAQIAERAFEPAACHSLRDRTRSGEQGLLLPYALGHDDRVHHHTRPHNLSRPDGSAEMAGRGLSRAREGSRIRSVAAMP
jgi:hypothetical protein